MLLFTKPFFIYCFLSSDTFHAVSTPAKPSRRSYHTATLVGSHLYIFGGKDFSLRVNDIFDYNMDDGSCTLLKPSGRIPPPRGYHSAVYYDGSIYVFGGDNDNRIFYDDLFQYIIGMFFSFALIIHLQCLS